MLQASMTGVPLNEKKIAAVATAENKWLRRENFYISNVVTCMDVTVGSEKYSHECGQNFPWALVSLQTWSSLTWEDQKRDKKWLYWDDSFAKRGCVPAMAFQEAAVLGLWALFLTTMQVCAFIPAPPFSSSGYIHLEGWPSTELCHRVELMLSSSPFAFSTLLFPPVQLSAAICGPTSVPSVAGDYCAGAGTYSREQKIFCACRWMCEALVILFAFGSNFLGLAIVKQLKGLTLAAWFPLAKALLNPVAITLFSNM